MPAPVNTTIRFIFCLANLVFQSPQKLREGFIF